MSSVTRTIVAMLAFGAILTITGCGSSTSSTKLRVLQASPDQPNTINTLLDNTVINSNLAYASNTGYLSVDAGSHTLGIELSTSTTPFINQSVVFGDNTQTTVILSNFAANPAALVYTDDTLAPPSGEFSIRVINSSPTMGFADVYIVPAGTSLGGTSPNVSSLGFEQATSYLSFSAGAYEIFLTAPNSKSVYIDTGQISFTSGQNRTIVALNASASGGYTSITLADLD